MHGQATPDYGREHALFDFWQSEIAEHARTCKVLSAMGLAIRPPGPSTSNQNRNERDRRMDPDQPVLLSIVIPAFNEERRLPSTLETLAVHCAKYSFGWEIIAVVEKSTDHTAEAASVVAARHPEVSVIVNQVQRGKGYALRTGVGLSRGSIVFTMDADLSVPPSYIDLFLKRFEDHPEVDFLMGNRQHRDTVIEVRQSRLRELLGKAFNALVRSVLQTRLGDTQCGFKAMRREAADQVYLRQTIDGFACDVEIVLLAERMGFRIQDLPIRWVNSPESRVRLVRDSTAMLWDVMRIRYRVARTLARRPYVRATPGVAASVA